MPEDDVTPELDQTVLDYLEKLEQLNPGHAAESAVRRLPHGTRFADAADLGFLPDPEWLVEPMLETDSFAVLYGGPGSHKSFYAVHMALELARAGRQVVYVAAEGFGGLKIRFQSWAAAFNENVIPRGVAVFRATEVLAPKSPLYLDALGYVAETRPALIIVDTVARTIDGSDNDNEAMSRFVNLCSALREEAPGCTLLAIHHSGHDDSRMRGATSLKAASDTVLRQTIGTIEVERSKNFENGHVLTYSHRVVDRSLVLDFISTESLEEQAAAVDAGLKAAFTYEVCAYLRAAPGSTSSTLLGLVPGRRAIKLEFLHELVQEGLLRTEPGAGKSVLHFLAEAQQAAGMVEA